MTPTMTHLVRVLALTSMYHYFLPEKVWQRVGKRASPKTSPPSMIHVKGENRYAAIDTESDPENGIGDIDDFDPPHACQSSKMPFIFLPIQPLTNLPMSLFSVM